MTIERTLSIIKPDAVSKNIIGEIISRFEKSGLYIVAIKMLLLSKDEAENFYYVHRNRNFYSDLVSFMISGPILVQVLEGENAVMKNRKIMGATDPLKAEEGTLRKMYGISIDKNSVHGSDSVENAKTEIGFFFK